MYHTRSTGSLHLVGKEETSGTKYSKLTEFESIYRDPDEGIPVKDRVLIAVKKHFARCNVKKSFLGLFPFIKTLKSYHLTEEFPNDVVAGLTAGIMMIPQGMAFATLSTLPPIVGLYISFFASVTYIPFGTGRQLSWGCIAVLSLMMATILDKYDNSVLGASGSGCINESTSQTLPSTSTVMTLLDATTNATAETTSSTKVIEALSTEKRMEVASAVSLIAGLVLIVASRLGFSKITALMSNSLVTGFAVGISVHVVTSQLKTLFGLSFPRYSGPAQIVRTWITLLTKLPETNLATLITAVICMLIIYLVKRFINEKYKDRMRIPVPIELFVVIIATVISTYANLSDKYDIKVVEDVPTGIPRPKIPDLSLATDYIGDGIVIILVSYAQTLAMAKTMGLKHNYVIDSNQEMLACGACNVVCGIFSGYITGASVSRTVVQDGAGGRTQIASCFAAGLVLLVIMVIGPYFYYLPMCVLSAIVVVNLRSMFLRLLTLPEEWRKSRYDCAVWVFTFLATVILNADIGLLAGVVFSLLLIVLRSMIGVINIAGQIQTSAVTVELRSIDRYTSAFELQKVKIIKVNSPLYFINADIFTSNVFHKTKINPVKIRKLKKKQEKSIEVSSNDAKDEIDVHNDKKDYNSLSNGANGKSDLHNNISALKDADVENLDERSLLEMKVLIFDVAGMSFVDKQGVQALQFLIDEFVSIDIEVLVTSVPESAIDVLKSTGFWDKNGQRLFLSVEAALASLVAAVQAVGNEAL